jgi:mono/diheme cytochrome c family protein
MKSRRIIRGLVLPAALATAITGAMVGARLAVGAFATQDGPPGSVAAGASVYAATCAECHGDRLDGAGRFGRFPPLVGRHTVPDYPNARVLYEYIRRAMPYNRPGSLSDEEALSVTAYLLNQNGLLPDDGGLSLDELDGFTLPGADPIAPPLPGAPEEPQTVTPGSSQAGPASGP